MTRNPRWLAAVATALLALTAACSSMPGEPAANSDEEELSIVAGFYPLEFVAQQVGGDTVAVTNLAQPGAEPHDLELKPSQIAQLAAADLVLYIKGFQPELDAAVAQNAADKALDIATVIPLLPDGAVEHEGEEEDEHGDEALDPHVWLDPSNMATIADTVAARLGRLDTDHAADYTAAATALRTELDQLDGDFATGLQTCERREIVTSHAAFGYLATRYDLEQIALSGLSPEIEPSPQRLTEVAREAKEHGATTIFFETLVSPKVAETLAQQVGASTAVLDPVEGLTPGSTGDYFTVMRANLAALRTALGCT